MGKDNRLGADPPGGGHPFIAVADSRQWRGFTLVELLVVVVIIAILALIAVPNFLAAQIRSKVSRAHQELRVLQVGIESYRVSTDRIPYDGEPGSTDVGWAASLSAITTPVAYVSSIPADVFQSPNVKSFPFHQSHMVFPATSGPHSYQYDSRRFLRVETDPSLAPDWSATFGSAIYLLRSCGPDLSEAGLNPPSWGYAVRYDPTNGTVSAGNIYRF